MELMLVVLVIGLVYGFAVGSMERYTDKRHELLTLRTLPKFLQGFHHNNHVSAICIDRCKECYLYVEGSAVKSLGPFIDDSAEVYRFDTRIGTREVSWTPLYSEDGHEEEVCFRYDIFADGSASEMMVEYRDEVIDFPSYFGKVARYESLEDALESKRAVIEKVTQ